ncbi:hypothetical protein DCAR_0625975 [Daucus carota subsp. sativus]|uniref:Uncharacterized protein n=1 Tax=Daucus carota subsp. sativus TaxID=79200 RepID=A0AAF1B7C4_DAUCS|nr:PREDICTED: uncharacterized protein LOC108225346 [Daucus carota subsp. sativus]WOH06547.1 hypothetical protein DCAR_0625975 [Daucus carota subsp. sativus]
MASSIVASVPVSGGFPLKSHDRLSTRSSMYGNTLKFHKKPYQQKSKRLSVRAEYGDQKAGTAGDFFAGFLLGGAVLGTLAYFFAPQLRRSLLNEDEYGFRRARRPIYYDDGLEKTRQTLNTKISQLNSAIDNVATRLRGGHKKPPVPVETAIDEAIM